ncbi:Small polypeptide DEVIL 14 [Linum perenne]
MAANTMMKTSMKLRWCRGCSRQFREQRTRLYIIWRCTVMLLRCHD